MVLVLWYIIFKSAVCICSTPGKNSYYVEVMGFYHNHWIWLIDEVWIHHLLTMKYKLWNPNCRNSRGKYIEIELRNQCKIAVFDWVKLLNISKGNYLVWVIERLDNLDYAVSKLSFLFCTHFPPLMLDKVLVCDFKKGCIVAMEKSMRNV